MFLRKLVLIEQLAKAFNKQLMEKIILQESLTWNYISLPSHIDFK